MARVLEGVILGRDAFVGDFALLGLAAAGSPPGALTEIGDDAVIRSHCVVYAGNRIGDRFRAGHGVLLREDNTIGHDVSVGTHSCIEHHVRIGDGVRIHSNVFVPEHTVLEDGAWLGPGACLTNARYPNAARTKEFLQGAHVETGAKIGANATLLPGIRVGRGALVGAGSVVTHDVPPAAVVMGNPARVVKDVGALRWAHDVDEGPYG